MKEQSPIETLIQKFNESFDKQKFLDWFNNNKVILLQSEKERDKKIASEAFMAGEEHEFEKHFGAIPPLSPNKEEYLKSLK